jgi:hypothetical protein
MFALWVLFKQVPNFLTNIPLTEQTPILKDILLNIDLFNWNMAKQLWIVNIMKYDKKTSTVLDEYSKKNQPTLSMFGSERGRFLQFLKYQLHELLQLCEPSCIKNRYIIRNDSEIIYFNKVNNIVNIHSTYTGKCPQCRSLISCEIKFLKNPNFVFIEAAFANIFINDLPKLITLNNNNYRFLCATVFKSNISHFVGIFEINNNYRKSLLKVACTKRMNLGLGASAKHAKMIIFVILKVQHQNPNACV